MIPGELMDCPWCGQATRLELVKGHYQCTSCKRSVLDCCDGEQEKDQKKSPTSESQ